MKTVAELIVDLKKLPQDSVICVKSDPEGNQTHWLDEAAHGVAVKGVHGWRELESSEIDEYKEYGDPLYDIVTIWPGYGDRFDE